ncbi:OsmC family peroxiredoxin [candidate division KSB1 bacterium]|nr:OsmC family peroxiredoxin [candidate division KSB1 bacterium]
MKRKASAHWQGGLKAGMGTVSSESGALQHTPYAFHNRFENEPGTNPEELIAAAHAGCFAMALAGALEKAGMTAEALDVTATVTLEFVDGAPTVTASHLDLVAKIPGADAAQFKAAADGAKAGCPISRLLKAAITLDAKLK